MKRGLKILGMLAVVAGIGLTSDAVLASCQGEGPYEIFQCAKRTWFAVPPAGSGPIKIQLWQLGFGHAGSQPADLGQVVNNRGDGLVIYGQYSMSYNGTYGGAVFVGNDLLDAATASDIDVVDGQFIGGPPGSLCFSSASNWANPAIDGCSDNNRGPTTVPTTYGADLSDAFLNRYFDGTVVGTLRYNRQLDAPMATLLTEGSGKHFALAFFATEPRDPTGRASDLNPGGYSMGHLTNGDPNPVTSNNDIVPWQLIPTPNISATISGSDRMLTISWNPIRLVHDNTLRPCRAGAGVGNTPCTTLDGTTGPAAPNTAGVGIMNQPSLARYEVQTSPAPGGACANTWSNAAGPFEHPNAGPVSMTTQGDICVRLVTHLGRLPLSTFDPAQPCGDPTLPLCTNVTNAARGRLGDVGYNVASAGVVIGSATVSENVILKVAEKNKNRLLVEWETTAELNVTGFDIVGLDQKGDQKVLKGAIACKQCTTGSGATYSELLPAGALQGTKSVQILMHVSGQASPKASNVLTLR